MDKEHKLRLSAGIIAEYDPDKGMYLASFEYEERKTDIELKCDPDDRAGIDAIKNEFRIIHSGLILWDKVWFATLSENVINEMPKIVNMPLEICLIAKDVYKLIKLDFLTSDEGVVVKVTYGPEAPEDNKLPLIGVIGNFTRGFHDFFIGDDLIDAGNAREDHVFANGEVAEYDMTEGCYATTGPFADDIVDVFFQSDDDPSGAFDIYEELIRDDERYDRLARAFIEGEAEKIETMLGERVDTEELYLAVIRIGSDGSLEFEYRYDTTFELVDLHVRGTLNGGFADLDIDIG